MNKLVKLNLDTFGNTPAAISLARILNETQDSKSSRKVSKTLDNFNFALNEMVKMDKDVMFSVATVVYKYYLDTKLELPTLIKSYMNNVLSTQYKKWQIKHGASIPYNTRKKT